MRLGGFYLLLGGGHAGFGTGHVCAGSVNLAGGTNVSDRDACLRAEKVGLRVVIIGLGTSDRNFVVGVVDLHQHVAFVDELPVVIVDLHDLSADARADGIDVAVNLGVVGAFPATAVEPVPANRDHSSDHQSEHKVLRLGVALKKTAAGGFFNVAVVVIDVARSGLGS